MAQAILPPKKLKSLKDVGGVKGFFAWLNQLLAYVISITPLRTEFCEVEPDQFGTQILPLIPAIQAAIAAPIDFQLQGGSQLSIYGGTVSDNTTGGVVWTPTGLIAGKYTDSGADGGDSCAYLVISYTEGNPANITSVTFGTSDSVPGNESGTLYVPLGTFTYANNAFTVTSSPIGSQAFDAWHDWFAATLSFKANCWPTGTADL